MARTNLNLTIKQAEYIRQAHHRWNFAIGAVRSGKSHLAIQYIIPQMIISGSDQKGLNVILGVSRESIERNILEPMRVIWGSELVGSPTMANKAKLFGEDVYCIGAEKVNQVSKLRGSEIKFAYVDEICDINQEVFEMLKSRLSLPYSQCHAAANPQSPNHFIKKFIDTPNLDIYYQHYDIWDNPFLPQEYVEALETEYSDTVYYDRYILGQWTQAQGLIFPMYKDSCSEMKSATQEQFISCDYGIQNPFVALKWIKDEQGVWWIADEYYYDGRNEKHQKTDDDYVHDVLAFAEDMPQECEFYVDPSATSFIAALRRAERFRVRQAQNEVLPGIQNTAVCLQKKSVMIDSSHCPNLLDELAGYVWSDTDDKPIKEHDHACDAMRYGVQSKRLYRQNTEYKSFF